MLEIYRGYFDLEAKSGCLTKSAYIHHLTSGFYGSQYVSTAFVLFQQMFVLLIKHENFV
jgi:hypothetical protein